MKITPLKMWVQNVLPVVYDDSLSYYEMVGKINEKTNEIINQVNENTDDIEALNYVIQELGDIDELKALLEEVETIVSDLYTSDTPVMDSANGSAGIADHAARSDHSHPSDSSKADVSLGISDAIAGQYVRIKTVEDGVPTEFENYMPHEVPAGGATGQALKKNSSGNYDAGWDDTHEIPSGGTAGQALKKNSNTNYDASWSDTHEIPSGGNKNNVLVKDSNSNYDVVWTDTPAQMGSLATIETSPVENPNGYNVNDYLVYNGQLYKVIASISQGQTLTPGGNISAVTVVSELPKPSSGTPFVIANSNISNLERSSVRRYGHVVVLDIAFTVSETISDYTAILFSGAPPAFTYAQRFVLFSADNKKELILAVTTSGTIINQWTIDSITPNTYQGQCVYIAN